MIDALLEGRALGEACGAYRWYRPDLVLLPEYALSLIAEHFEAGAVPAVRPDQVLVVVDHFSPPASIERADIVCKVQAVCRRLGWPLQLFQGICHQRLIEDPRAVPGAIIVGSDSHTPTAGALGCLAMGFGSTDVLGALLTGRIALRFDRVVRVAIRGTIPKGVGGKDVILELFRRVGPEGLNYAVLQILDEASPRLTMSDRFTICNMIAEAGGKAAMFYPDETTRAYLAQRDGGTPELPRYDMPHSFDDVIVLDKLEPMVALPHSPFKVAPLRAHAGLPLEQVYIGSCNAGRAEDLEVAARLLAGRRVADGLKAIVVPGSVPVYLESLRKGHLETLMRAGVAIEHPSCGACGGIDKGILGHGERCAATINRNYQGRMGATDAEIYLVSSASAAASMITGRLTDPREFL